MAIASIESNPFATRFVRPGEVAYRVDSESTRADELAETLVTQLIASVLRNRRVAIVGPHGTGKTTLLRRLEVELKRQWPAAVSVRLSANQRAVPFRRADCMIVDGFEQLAAWQRWRLSRSVGVRSRHAIGHLVITSHRPHHGFVTAHRTRVDSKLARILTEERLSQLPPDERDILSDFFYSQITYCRPKQCRLSDDSVRDDSINLRDLWFSMYDEVERVRREKNSE